MMCGFKSLLKETLLTTILPFQVVWIVYAVVQIFLYLTNLIVIFLFFKFITIVLNKGKQKMNWFENF